MTYFEYIINIFINILNTLNIFWYWIIEILLTFKWIKYFILFWEVAPYIFYMSCEIKWKWPPQGTNLRILLGMLSKEHHVVVASWLITARSNIRLSILMLGPLLVPLELQQKVSLPPHLLRKYISWECHISF
jgi:hypothetical protein